MTALSEIEATGEKFSVKPFLEMRQRTRRAVNDIASRVKVGMVEEDARAHGARPAGGTRDEQGLAPHHRPLRAEHDQGLHGALREGRRARRPTTSSSSTSGQCTGTMEGDGGDTFVFGSDPDHHRAKSDVKVIWDDVRETLVSREAHRPQALRLRREESRRQGMAAQPRSRPGTASRSSRTRPTTTGRWPPWTSARRLCSGSSRSPSSTRSASSAPSTRTSSSRTSRSTERLDAQPNEIRGRPATCRLRGARADRGPPLGEWI